MHISNASYFGHLTGNTRSAARVPSGSTGATSGWNWNTTSARGDTVTLSSQAAAATSGTGSDLLDKIADALKALIEKAAQAGVTIVVRDGGGGDTPAPATTSSTPATPATTTPSTPTTTTPAASAPAAASVRELISGTVAATTTAVSSATAVKLTGLARAAAASGNPVVAAKATATSATAATVPDTGASDTAATDTATATTDTAPPAASAAARRVIVITAAALAQVTSFKALMSLVDKVESGIATTASGTTTIDTAQSAATQAAAQSFLAQTDNAPDTQQVRALKAYQQVVNLVTEQLDQPTTTPTWARPRGAGFAA